MVRKVQRIALLTIVLLLIVSTASAWTTYDDVGYGLYEIRTKNRSARVNVRSAPSKDAWVADYAEYGDRYIALENRDGWVLVIQPYLYKLGR